VRFVSYDDGRGPRAGVLVGDTVADVWEALEPGAADATLDALLADERFAEAVEMDWGGGVPSADVRLLPPVGRPSKIVCIGLNYRSHAEEAGLDPPETPTFFAKFPNALAAPGAEVALPEWSDKVDYEAEVAFVMGASAKDVPEDRALDHVAGYTLLNDLSARDWQFRTPQWMPGKVFDGSAPCGPALVTRAEAAPHDAIEIALHRNGEELQRATTADLVHSIPALVAQLSRLMTLEPGDIVATGTPAGVGSTREPRIWLEPGDELVVSSPTLGRLETRLR
jgi:2-keto-4-pentenoate hydratase/2-oxohepta-3-ene-1,7-dioic acid hydratase in catechol pathway